MSDVTFSIKLLLSLYLNVLYLCFPFNLVKTIFPYTLHSPFGINNMLIVQLHQDTDWLWEDLITPLTADLCIFPLNCDLVGIGLKLAIASNANTTISQIVLFFGFTTNALKFQNFILSFTCVV